MATTKGVHTVYFWSFSSTTSRLSDKCLPNGTRCRQAGNGAENNEWSPLVSRHFMNFGPQMPKNTTFVFTYPLQILHSASSPSLAHGDQQRNSFKLCERYEVNHRAKHFRKKLGSPLLKKSGPKLSSSGRFLRRLQDLVANVLLMKHAVYKRERS